MDDMAEAIEGLGIAVEVMHTESAPGQFEIVTRYGPALKARDHHFASLILHAYLSSFGSYRRAEGLL